MIASVYIPSSMNKYNCTATLCRCTTTTPYRSARNVSKTLCCSSILFQIPICRLYAGTAYEAVFHPASYTYTVDRSLSGVLAKLKFVDCAWKSRDWNAISGFWECATQSRDCANSQLVQKIHLSGGLRASFIAYTLFGIFYFECYFCKLVKNMIFVEKTFVDCGLLPYQSMPCPQIL